MDECRREKSVWLTTRLYWHKPQRLSDRRAHNFLPGKNHQTQSDHHVGDNRTALRDSSPQRVAPLRGLASLLTDAVDALNAHRSFYLAFRACRASAPLTPHIGDPVRMARTDRLRGVRIRVSRHVVYSSMVTRSITTGSRGRSRPSVSTAPILSTTALDSSSATSPKTVCLPNSHGVGATVMKNCEPLVPLPMRTPAFAIASLYGSLKFNSG